MKKESTENDYDFFHLDKDNLDGEWVNQPTLFHTYARKLANARSKLEQAKVELEVVDAELDLQIRDNPSHYDISKVTEGAISKVIIAQKEHRIATHNLLQAKHKVDLLQATVTALDHRKKALENLVELRLADYFAEPRAKSNGSHESIEEGRRKRLFKPVKKEDRENGE